MLLDSKDSFLDSKGTFGFNIGGFLHLDNMLFGIHKCFYLVVSIFYIQIFFLVKLFNLQLILYLLVLHLVVSY